MLGRRVPRNWDFAFAIQDAGRQALVMPGTCLACGRCVFARDGLVVIASEIAPLKRHPPFLASLIKASSPGY